MIWLFIYGKVRVCVWGYGGVNIEVGFWAVGFLGIVYIVFVLFSKLVRVRSMLAYVFVLLNVYLIFLGCFNLDSRLVFLLGFAFVFKFSFFVYFSGLV